MTHFRVFAASARAPRLRSGLVLAGGAVALLALVGCSTDSEPSASETPSASSSAAATDAPGESAAPTATPSPTPTPAGTAVALSCDQVLTAEDVYAFNPNFGTAPAFEPTGDAATAVEYNGVACGYMNQTSNAVIEIGIAAPNEVLRNQQYDAAIAQSTPVPTYGDAPSLYGFFTSINGVGEAQIFTDTYWVTLTSVEFFEPGDAQGLLAAVVSHLP
ncbi:iron ABC transporter ATP-binding protein [Cryobacterium melibiosiphilum]|uniref:Iron ABC transporter ATP-binding protein n=1 Tax=Cryobacterium melibiosiphilum TaxID=995039 RepID=A0A3A5MNA4_9MICO|nr:iron ABC transporter ATP-binding protein [Cryobacterium melibiosiphilum]RJT87516.1 iron ABC transporter ATP-binding protein [Cryobacterium melibiosiphilum]